MRHRCRRRALTPCRLGLERGNIDATGRILDGLGPDTYRSPQSSEAPDDVLAAELIEQLRDGPPSVKAAARLGLADIFERRGQLDLVAELLAANTAQGEADARTLQRLAATYRALGRPDEAVEAAWRAQAVGPAEHTLASPPHDTAGRTPPRRWERETAPMPRATARSYGRRQAGPRRRTPVFALGIAACALVVALLGAGLLGAALVSSGSTLSSAVSSAPVDPPDTSVPWARASNAEGGPPATANPPVETEQAPAVPTAPPVTHPAVPPTATAMAPATAQSSQPTPSAAPGLEDAAERAKSFTALVITNDGLGSAFAIGEGRFITNFHVVEGARSIRVRVANDEALPAEVVQYDDLRDLAMLKVEGADVPAADIRDARELRSAETLLVVGYPQADRLRPSESTVTRGIFSARWQSPWDVWHVQMDAPINPGNSGGPVIDAQGRVVGVATMSLRGTVGLNFAVASDEVLSFLSGQGAVSRPPATGRPPTEARVPVQGARPELANVIVPSVTVPPGGTATLSYDIVNPNDVPVQAVLGASIRLGGGKWLDDRASDRTVTAPPGRSTQARQFRVPEDAEAGSYDVWTSLLSEDMKTSYGQKVAPGVLGVRAGTAPVPAPPAAPAPRSSAPEDAVRRHYAALGARDFQTAWGLLSPDVKADIAFEDWAAGYRTTQSVTVTSISTVAQTASAATVQVTVVSTDVQDGRTITQTFSGTRQLVNSGGTWLLDAASMRKVR